MTVRQDREIDGPPSKALAALATAGENLGYTVRDVRTDPKMVLMSSGVTLSGASFGFLVTGRARRRRRGSLLSIDVTPVLGSWAVHSASERLDQLVREFQAVLSAPKARIRAPEKKRPGSRPFGYIPEVLAAAWALLALLVYGFGFGGWLWLPAAGSVGGAAMVAKPRTEAWWSWTVVGLSLLSLPFGLFGAIARRLALANTYWESTFFP